MKQFPIYIHYIILINFLIKKTKILHKKDTFFFFYKNYSLQIDRPTQLECS